MALPVVDYLKLPENGEPFLEGHKCSKCNAMFLGERKVCSSCFSRDTLEAVKLNNTGKLYSYSIVCRSFPGIDVTYISAIVDSIFFHFFKLHIIVFCLCRPHIVVQSFRISK